MENTIKPYTQEINTRGDDRGVFVPFLNSTNQLPDATNLMIKRMYYVYNYGKGVVRGFHFHRKEWKYFIIVNGAAKFVMINPDKPEEVFTFISSSRRPNMIVVPPGFANGWVSLEDETILVCGSTSSFEESVGDDQRMDPYKWGDFWTVKGR
jgi:dTDP-4-dehydrorhamnose 3,5-epimerase-like enzyme